MTDKYKEALEHLSSIADSYNWERGIGAMEEWEGDNSSYWHEKFKCIRDAIKDGAALSPQPQIDVEALAEEFFAYFASDGAPFRKDEEALVKGIAWASYDYAAERNLLRTQAPVAPVEGEHLPNIPRHPLGCQCEPCCKIRAALTGDKEDCKTNKE